MNELSRLLAKVNKTDSCWIWMASQNGHGYGQFRYRGMTRSAHRAAYELLVGPIPDGLDLDHICRVRNCVNPDHLEPVTHAENVRRGNSGSKWAAKTHCPHGHAYTPENTVHYPSGSRACRTCQRGRTAIQNRKRRAR